MTNQLILGDNLTLMREMASESIDLIYLDPPFFSNRHYETLWGDDGEIRSFEDRWAGGIEHYIAWLKERVFEMHRLLKPTGSIFLHCDWHADAYIRVYILDKIFGEKNFLNDIVWCYGSGGASKSHFSRKHDTIFWYRKSSEYTFNVDEVREEYSSPEKVKYKVIKGKSYLRKNELGRVPFDWWAMPILTNTAKERIGYPTQKPEALLERIILAASNKGDVVLDPFVGGGTTIVVADKLERRWIGIDQSVAAIKVSEMRLELSPRLFSLPFSVKLHKYDYDTLRYKDAFAFETWIIEQFGGLPNTKQRNDFGLDGKMRDGTPIQVKRSDNVGRIVVDNFLAACQRNDKKLLEQQREAGQTVGFIIAFSFAKGAISEVARLKNEDNLKIELIRVDSIIQIAKKPSLKVTMQADSTDAKGLREMTFTATAESEAKIEFFAWDWHYDAATKTFKPEVLLDKEGQQQQKFAPGKHTVGVKVVDSDGLETIETLQFELHTD